VIRIVAVPDPGRLGFLVEVIVGLHVDMPQLRSIAETPRDLSRVRYVSITSRTSDPIIPTIGAIRAE